MTEELLRGDYTLYLGLLSLLTLAATKRTLDVVPKLSYKNKKESFQWISGNPSAPSIFTKSAVKPKKTMIMRPGGENLPPICFKSYQLEVC